MKKYDYFSFLSRMKNINRWGLMRNTQNENLMEHSFETALIANALANIENEFFGKKLNAEKITTAALFHDTSEILTGDLPTPVKYNNEKITKAYKEIEENAKNRILSMLPSELYDVYRSYYSLEGIENDIIKAADKISALIKCVREINGGNNEFVSAKESIYKKVMDINIESVKYFMENFYPSYEKTLDEICL